MVSSFNLTSIRLSIHPNTIDHQYSCWILLFFVGCTCFTQINKKYREKKEWKSIEFIKSKEKKVVLYTFVFLWSSLCIWLAVTRRDLNYINLEFVLFFILERVLCCIFNRRFTKLEALKWSALYFFFIEFSFLVLFKRKNARKWQVQKKINSKK